MKIETLQKDRNDRMNELNEKFSKMGENKSMQDHQLKEMI